GTTAEHPFWVLDKGWRPATMLEPGDRLVGHDGRLTPVEAIRATGRFETVYNVEIEQDHTYFVGSPEWGFSVWAHNWTCGPSNGNSARSTKANHGYVIFDRTTGEIHKFGISSSKLTQAGNSPRAVSQLNKLNAAGGNWTSLVLAEFKNRADALLWEKRTVG